MSDVVEQQLIFSILYIILDMIQCFDTDQKVHELIYVYWLSLCFLHCGHMCAHVHHDLPSLHACGNLLSLGYLHFPNYN